MTLKLTKWDMAEHINSESDVIEYLNIAFEDGNPELVLAIIGDIARSEGMTKIARNLGVARESLYRSLSADGNPSFITVIGVLQLLGFRLSINPTQALTV
jgi:probable addiction module antidote protein